MTTILNTLFNSRNLDLLYLQYCQYVENNEILLYLTYMVQALNPRAQPLSFLIRIRISMALGSGSTFFHPEPVKKISQY